ncbi:MAG: DNA polymerase III subunit beta [Oscillospiraceae bacterium]|nr:DNA polymerase III subunit beta [Oscillospiraceae bacterium]
MKISCEKMILQSAIATAARAVSPRSSLPVLEGILFQAEGQSLKLTGYDLKKAVYTSVDATVQETGAAVINAKLIYDIVRAMPDGMVNIAVAENTAQVRCGKAEYNIPVMKATDFPELPEFEEDKSFSMEQGLLKEMINETIFAVSDSESRPVYMGTLFKLEEGVLTMVSVDGYRLALRKEAVAGADVDSFIVPGSALADVERICGDTDEKITVSISAKHVFFEIGETSLISRRLEGEFLNYKSAIPEKFRYEVTVDRQELLRTVGRVALIVDDKTRIPIRLTFADGVVNVRCATVLGSGVDSCICEGNGGGIEIGFNHKYISDALKAAPADEIRICLNTGSAPCVIRPADGSEDFTYLVLPVRLRSE